MLLKQWLEAIDYAITEGSDYGWRCYGDRAYSLDSWNGEQNGHSFSVVFDREDQTVYEMTAYDYANDRAYRWINPLNRDLLFAEAKERNTDVKEAWEGVNYVDLEVVEDYLEKAHAIRESEEYDTRVQIPLTLPDDALYRLMQMAHEQDLTLNQFVENILREEIDRLAKEEPAKLD